MGKNRRSGNTRRPQPQPQPPQPPQPPPPRVDETLISIDQRGGKPDITRKVQSAKEKK